MKISQVMRADVEICAPDVVPERVQRARVSGGHRSRIKRPNPMMLLVVARIIVTAVVAAAIAFAVGGPFNWRQALGGLLPGWPWW